MYKKLFPVNKVQLYLWAMFVVQILFYKNGNKIKYYQQNKQLMKMALSRYEDNLL